MNKNNQRISLYAILTVLSLAWLIIVLGLLYNKPVYTIMIPYNNDVFNAGIEYHGIKYYDLRFAPGDDITKASFYFIRNKLACEFFSEQFLKDYYKNNMEE